MTLDWSHFTPWSALAGGLLVGAGTAVFLLGAGRVAGIAGLVGSPLRAILFRTGLTHERPGLLFLLGLAVAPWAWRLFAPLPVSESDVGTPLLIAAGVLVGIGVRLGNGCTSGHGVCGLSRLSGRSLANVAAFMTAGMATVFVLRHVLGIGA